MSFQTKIYQNENDNNCQLPPTLLRSTFQLTNIYTIIGLLLLNWSRSLTLHLCDILLQFIEFLNIFFLYTWVTYGPVLIIRLMEVPRGGRFYPCLSLYYCFEGRNFCPLVSVQRKANGLFYTAEKGKQLPQTS